MDPLTGTWIHWKGTWIWWREHGSCCSIWNGTWISNSKQWSAQHLFGWSGHGLMWMFIFELAHALVWDLMPNFSHRDLGCIWGLNPDAGHFAMAWSLAYDKLKCWMGSTLGSCEVDYVCVSSVENHESFKLIPIMVRVDIVRAIFMASNITKWSWHQLRICP